MTRSRRPWRQRLTVVAAISAAAVAASLIGAAAPAQALTGAHYVDCGGAANGTGALASPWNSLASVNAHVFAAGDSILFARGVTCTGALVLKNSGITVDVYGSGTGRAIIDGTGQNTAVTLIDTSNITVSNLEIKNSTYRGLFVTTTGAAIISGVTLRDLSVHHVSGGVMDKKETGLIVMWPGGKGGKINSVLIDNVDAYETTLWAGILVSGMNLTGDRRWKSTARNIANRSTNLTIRNSRVHDVQGDGILVLYGNGVLIDNNTTYRSGEQTVQTIGTPNAIWTFASNSAVVQYNEAYWNDSPGQDGGAFDIDFFSSDTTVQYNYAHDNSTYCIAVFGAESAGTVNSIIRYNVCANNGYIGGDGRGRSELYFGTWNSGWIDGLQVYNNTFYSTSSQGLVTEIKSDATTGASLVTKYSGTLPRVFKNNLVVDSGAAPSSNIYGNAFNTAFLTKSNNLYFRTTGSIPVGAEAGSKYNLNPLVSSLGYAGIGEPTTQWQLQPGSPAINAGATYAAPALDYFGLSTPVGQRDIGAHEAR